MGKRVQMAYNFRQILLRVANLSLPETYFRLFPDKLAPLVGWRPEQPPRCPAP